MKVAVLTVGLVLMHALPALAIDRADVKKQAIEASHAPQYGEAQPPVLSKPKVSKEERQAARKLRRQQGAEAAKVTGSAEGNPIPAAQAKPTKEARAAARSERRAEARRANKAGEITSKGEVSY